MIYFSIVQVLVQTVQWRVHCTIAATLTDLCLMFEAAFGDPIHYSILALSQIIISTKILKIGLKFCKLRGFKEEAPSVVQYHFRRQTVNIYISNIYMKIVSADVSRQNSFLVGILPLSVCNYPRQTRARAEWRPAGLGWLIKFLYGDTIPAVGGCTLIHLHLITPASTAAPRRKYGNM